MGFDYDGDAAWRSLAACVLLSCACMVEILQEKCEMVFVMVRGRERHRNRQTEKGTETDRWTDKQTDRGSERQQDSQRREEHSMIES